MPVIKSFSSVPWSYNGRSNSISNSAQNFGFGNIRRYQSVYVPLYRDPSIIKATEVIQRPDIAVGVPLAGDTGASKGQEQLKNDAVIERKLDLPEASKISPAEHQEGKGVTNEAKIQSLSTKDLKAQSEKDSKRKVTFSEPEVSSYAKAKQRRIEQRDRDFALR